MTQTIDQTLAERGSRYGDFIDHAEVTQSIKCSMASGQNWDTLPDDMKECLEMVAHKVGRILNGDPDYVDSWTDIIGYTRLVEKRLIDEQRKDPTGKPEIDEEKKPTLADQWENAIFDALRGERKTADKCDDPKCFVCNPSKPSQSDIESALTTLLAAGVIKHDGNT
jgi:hypothetical protein